jgi:hypothetical protein
MAKGKQKKPTKELEAYVDRHGGIRVDGCWIDTDADLLLYKGFAFRFEKACWLVTDRHVEQARSRFRTLGLLPKERKGKQS